MDARSARASRRLLIGIGIVVAALLLLDGFVVLTDQPGLCATCHEMRTFYAAWQHSPHKRQGCVDCHVDSGLPGRLVARYPTAQQIAAHVLGRATFPLETPSKVADARCTPCHSRLPAKTPRGFGHGIHNGVACAKCHPDTGHAVTVEALKNTGVYPRDGRTPLPASMPLRPGNGAANLQGHPHVTCSDCHDMGLTGCSVCHKARHRNNANRGSDCVSCHKPAAKWTFTHPAPTSPCKYCHTVPTDHKAVKGRECTSCHAQAGVSWASSHPGAGVTQPCKSCHKLPSSHVLNMTRTCLACHKRAGVSWLASHPGVESKCEICHTAPAGNHPPGVCPRCHGEIGVSFVFTHPKLKYAHKGASQIVCTKCHPNNYTSYSCICHK